MWHTLRKTALACVDIAVFKAAIAYHCTPRLPCKAQLARLVDRYALRPKRRPATPSMLESAAAGSDDALAQLQREHPTLRIERDASGGLKIREA